MRWVVFGVLLTIALLLAGFVYRQRHRPRPVAAPSQDAEDGLPLEVVLRQEGGERRLLLRSRSGAATLLLAPAAGSGLVTFGTGRFEPRDREEGAGFVADVARWLGRDAPAAPAAQGELEPFPISYAFLGADGGMENTKLFLEYGNRYAEVFLNFDRSGRSALLLEKDEEYRGDLVALLALALRDGPPPRRTTATDPNLASDEPLVSDLRPLACDGEISLAAWTTRGFVGAVGKRPARLVLWGEPSSQPTSVGVADGVVTALLSSANGERVGAIVVHPGSPDFYTTEDPTDLLLLDVASGATRTVPGDEPGVSLVSGSLCSFSPGGDRVAVSAYAGSERPRRFQARVYDAVSGSKLFETDPALDLSVEAWDPEGLLLCRGEFEDAGYKQTWFRWRLGEGIPAEVAKPPSRSPDGRYAIAANAEGNLEVRGPAGVRTHAAGDADERAAYGQLGQVSPSWLGPHSLLVPCADLLVLDLETLKLQHVFPERGWSFVATDPSGRNVLVIDADGAPHWGTVP